MVMKFWEEIHTNRKVLEVKREASSSKYYHALIITFRTVHHIIVMIKSITCFQYKVDGILTRVVGFTFLFR
jgi:hypothetical protein